jgi:hypothetical protein
VKPTTQNDAPSGSDADNLGIVMGGAMGDNVHTVSDENVLVPILVRAGNGGIASPCVGCDDGDKGGGTRPTRDIRRLAVDISFFNQFQPRLGHVESTDY